MIKHTRLLFFLFFLILLFPLMAQNDESGEAEEAEPPSLALLTQGPIFTEGIPFLGPNVLEAWSGRYLMGEDEVYVYYSGDELLIPGGWSDFSCNGEAYRTSAFREGAVYYILSPRGWSVFIYFSEIDRDHCRFLKRFYNRLNYFLGISETFSLPAVLELE